MKKKSIYRVWHTLRFQAPSGGSWDVCPKDGGGCDLVTPPVHGKAPASVLLSFDCTVSKINQSINHSCGKGIEKHNEIHNAV